MMIDFTHLHVHTQYSILDGACRIPDLISKARKDGMDAIAITDHGSLFGVKEFFNSAKSNGIKPIMGCEVYQARKSRFDRKEREDRSGFHLVLLARNKTGYQNLIRLVSLAWIEGHYYKPRIDRELLEKYHEGLIASSACLGGEIPEAILDDDIEKAEEATEYLKNLFGNDFYLELQRHKTTDPDADQQTYKKQKKVNQKLIELAEKFEVKLIATNDVHFLNQEDAGAHDRLICLNTNADVADPSRLRYTRQEWFKTREEMLELFEDMPEALSNTREVADKVELYDLNSKPIMPDFPLPEGFKDEDDYLRHITCEGAAERYGNIDKNIAERIDFELGVIKKMGYPGYFLIVQDFLAAARKMGVSVGPGRGSAAGSVVAYCIRITDVDPLRYKLLFERFLNPDRISMPDIDIDFDEDGRDKVLRYVVDKYKSDHVAHIITFGTMAAKMAIRDVARIEKLSLQEADRLAKLVPERPGITLRKAFSEVKELKDARNNGSDVVRRVLKYAETLEGSVRHTALHACGIIIGKGKLIDHIPVCTSKETDLLVTQFDGNHVENVGMLKMDFLGLKTLSIIKDAMKLIRESKGVDIDPGRIPLDDQKTFDLYSRAETTGVFQFESDGMKKHLKELKPNRLEDLIAMNALYRPGPMEYIPRFIARKHGKEKIHYPLPCMKEMLEDTYGITVYQEQVMQLSQAMAGFTGGQADSLRKAMGKKKRKMMEDLEEKFFSGCRENGIHEKVARQIWTDWEAFAQYAFNKSHSTCYAYVSYRTAYLKANYPAEFMAAVLSRNLNDIKKITVFMNECRRMKLQVLGPDVNESDIHFKVDDQGSIRFGMAAIKGIGTSAVKKIIEEREHENKFRNIFDFMERIDLHSVNKKGLEALAAAGAFDCFGDLSRGQYFAKDDKGISFLEQLVRYGQRVQSDRRVHQQSLFAGGPQSEYAKPQLPDAGDWPKLERLGKEKELIGVYLSAHPLDDFLLEIENFCTHNLSELSDLKTLNGREITFAGIVKNVRHSYTKNNNPFGSIVLEDYTDSMKLTFFSRDYISYKNYFTAGYTLLVKGQVQPRPYSNGGENYEIKVKDMMMLADVREQMIRSISLNISLNRLTDDLIGAVMKHAVTSRGKTRIRFMVTDPDEHIQIEMFSRKYKVKPTSEFLNFLDNNSQIEYKIN